MAGCRALIFPGEEDFGLAPVEAQACGRPVIAYGMGGALASVVDGVTGVFFGEQTPEALAAAVRRFRDEQFDPQVIRRHAEQFDTQRFLERFERFVEDRIAERTHTGASWRERIHRNQRPAGNACDVGAGGRRFECESIVWSAREMRE